MSARVQVRYFVTALDTAPRFAASLNQPSGKPINDFLRVSWSFSEGDMPQLPDMRRTITIPLAPNLYDEDAVERRHAMLNSFMFTFGYIVSDLFYIAEERLPMRLLRGSSFFQHATNSLGLPVQVQMPVFLETFYLPMIVS